MAITILAAIIPLLFFIYKPVFVWGLGLGAIVVVYFVLQKKLGFLKEPLGALLYSAGVLLPVIALSEKPIRSIISIPVILFFNTALINLVLFSWFDKDKDIVDKHASLVTIFGNKIAERFLYLVFILQSVLIIKSFQVTEPAVLIIFSLMNLLLLLIFLRAKWFSINDRYRLTGDAVFLLPIIYIFLN
jgi:4-hydroxybenzoate polyprenyltransferase